MSWFPSRAPSSALIPSWPGRPLMAAVIVGGLLGAGGSVFAQPQGAPGSASPPAGRPESGRGATLTARYHVRQMENVLERAVQHAADMMRRRLAAFTPDVLALAGAPRAQGYRIDGYGLFFSVEVPRLSESVTWALRVLSEDRDERVVASLQKVAAAEQDPVVRADLERAIRTIQLQQPASALPPMSPPEGPQRRASSTSAAARPTSPPPVSGAAPPAGPQVATSEREGVAAEDATVADGSPSMAAASAQPLPPMSVAPAPTPAPETPASGPPRDPSAAYEDEVKQALVDAMLDYAGSLQLPASEWVTVAARDAGYLAFPDAVTDMVTVTLSIRVSDLVDFRAQRLTREEARTRVLVREF